MTTYGVTSLGFVAKTTEVILAEITAEALQLIDPNLNTAPTEPIGQILGIMAKRERALWEALEAAFVALDPDAAEDFSLENLCALTGVRRNPATRSVLRDVAVTLADGATLPAGSTAHVLNQPTRLFRSISEVVANVGAGVYNVDFESVDFGPVPANAGTLTVIAGPVTGWSAVTNPTDAILGELEEEDTALRIRREASLQAQGGSGIDHVRSDLYALADSEDVANDFAAFVYENTTRFTDADGRPGHSIECVIYDGLVPALDDVDIAQTIWDSKGSGVGTYGTSSAVATDAVGDSHLVYFARAVQVPIYIDAIITTRSGISVASVSAAVKTKLVEFGRAEFPLGEDVIALALRAAILEVPGVVDVPTFELGTSPSPSGTANIPITIREIATFDTSRITVA